MIEEKPDGIIITLSRNMFEQKGYGHWYRNFMSAMEKCDGDHPFTYWFRTSARPKHEVMYLYLCIAGKIRFRCNLVETQGAGDIEFPSGNEDGDLWQKGAPGNVHLYGRAWLVCCGPVEIARRPMIERQGFQGFRYTQKLF